MARDVERAHYIADSLSVRRGALPAVGITELAEGEVAVRLSIREVGTSAKGNESSGSSCGAIDCDLVSGEGGVAAGSCALSNRLVHVQSRRSVSLILLSHSGMVLGVVAEELYDVAHVVQPEMPLDGFFSEAYGYRSEARRDAFALLVCVVELVRGPVQS